MTTGKWKAALSILTVSAFGFVPAAPAAEDQNDQACAALPDGAVTALPAPLSKWGRILCTPAGQVLGSQKGWAWILPGALKPVYIPSRPAGEPEQGVAYFAKIVISPVDGDEFQKAYEAFHEGFDKDDRIPDGYRADLTSSSGKSLRVFFFDYDRYAWGIACPGDVCMGETRFVILDMKRPPQSRQQIARAHSI